MDPTEDEQKQMDKLAAVFTWVGLPAGEMNDETKLPGSLARLLGATQDTKPVTLGVVSKGDYEAVISRWKVPETAGARPPTLAEIGAAKLVGHVCRFGRPVPAARRAYMAVDTARVTAPSFRFRISLDEDRLPAFPTPGSAGFPRRGERRRGRRPDG